MRISNVVSDILVVVLPFIFANCALGETYLHYACQAGEKPGSPEYDLTIHGSKYHVQKASLLLPKSDTIRTGDGTISPDLLSELVLIAPILPTAFNALKKLPSAGVLTGYCSWSIDADGAVASVEFPNTKKLGTEFDEFLFWIRKLPITDKDNRAIKAIIPGEDTTPFP